jgi:hypothetical protein
MALANLHRQFTVPVDLCKECLFVKHLDELDKYEGYCEECAPPPVPIYNPLPSQPEDEPAETSKPTPEPTIEPTTEPTPASTPEPDLNQQHIAILQQQVETQNQLIQQLQQKVAKLEEFNHNLLQYFQQDAQAAQQRYEALGNLNF